MIRKEAVVGGFASPADPGAGGRPYGRRQGAILHTPPLVLRSPQGQARGDLLQYNFVSSDPGACVHNAWYEAQLLYESPDQSATEFRTTARCSTGRPDSSGNRTGKGVDTGEEKEREGKRSERMTAVME